MPRNRPLIVLAAVLAAAAGGVLAGCGDDGGRPTGATSTRPATTTAARVDGVARITPAAGVRQRALGTGAATVTILEAITQAPGPRPVVVFLHGWGAISPEFYAPWLVHLVREGSTVVFPRYQESVLTPPAQTLGTTVRSLRAAFAAAPPAPGSLVVAGHSAGGALAADYAATAVKRGLPVPAAVFAVYPGRSLRGVPAQLPEADPQGTPGDTEVVALGSRRDDTVGTATARRIGRLGRYVAVTDPAAGEHRAPLQDTPAARRTFWAPLDALITRVRGRARGR